MMALYVGTQKWKHNMILLLALRMRWNILKLDSIRRLHVTDEIVFSDFLVTVFYVHTVPLSNLIAYGIHWMCCI